MTYDDIFNLFHTSQSSQSSAATVNFFSLRPLDPSPSAFALAANDKQSFNMTLSSKKEKKKRKVNNFIKINF